jgi:hypothetical protein
MGECSRLEAALWYARQGWPVFPLVPGEKRPQTAHGFKDATTGPEQIRSWWANNPDRNIGIATGTPGPDVVDVDHKGPGADGFSSWGEVRQHGIGGGPTMLVRTPSGGFHAYYVGSTQGNGCIRGRYVDFRSAGGYVVAAPSQVGGKPYELVQHRASSATVDWAAIRNLLAPPAPPPARYTGRPQDDTAEGHLTRLANWAAGFGPGQRNWPIFYAAKHAYLNGADVHAIFVQLLRAAEISGLRGGQREARATIASGIRAARAIR